MQKKNRLDAIENRIQNFENNLKPKQINQNSGKIFNIAIELMASVIVGLIIGAFLDNLFASKPLFIIICIMFAMIASFRSIYRSIK